MNETVLEGKAKTVEIERETITFETGKWARQADGSVLYKVGKSTILLATACASKKPVEGADFLPLTVEYREKFYSLGRFPGGFIKRENRSSEVEILTSRLIDRPIRPLFPKGYFHEIQVIVQVISYDGVVPLQSHAINAASLSLCLSSIPFDGPVASVVVGKIEGELIINPTTDEIPLSDFLLLVAGNEDAIVMIEGEAKEIPSAEILEALEYAHRFIQEHLRQQSAFIAEVGVEKKEIELKLPDSAFVEEVKAYARSHLEEAIRVEGKLNRQKAVEKAKLETIERFKEIIPDITDEQVKTVEDALDELEVDIVRQMIFEKGIRADGRKLDEIRPITIELDVLPGTHGSAVFTRGETQAMGVLTLGSTADSQKYDFLIGRGEKRFMLHYNFPPFSVGEVKKLGPPGRREVGHGYLAERALKPVLPDPSDFPYTIRIVSEILESNGSSSMASVCVGSLALMAGGVPITSHVAGVAMGLIKDRDRYAILTDIAGLEDHFGDMDFKLAGTEKGITAFQLDLKIKGVEFAILREAVEQAEEGIRFILDTMKKAIEVPRIQLAKSAPKIINLQIDKDKIGLLIGTGGKTIREIIDKSGADIEIDPEGKVTIFAQSQSAAEKAKELIDALFEDVEIGKVYQGTVTRVADFGVFVEILPGRVGLCHISKLDEQRIDDIYNYIDVGDSILVKVMSIDKQGRIELSKKDALKPSSPSDEYYQKHEDHRRSRNRSYARADRYKKTPKKRNRKPWN